VKRFSLVVWTAIFGCLSLGLFAGPQGPAAAASAGGREPAWSSAAEMPPAERRPTRGMSQEQVRALWGEPAEVRRIRTCFGTQEEWVYRGEPRRFGGEERTLLFDEGGILTEIKP
jgi:hypothetical protein